MHVSTIVVVLLRGINNMKIVGLIENGMIYILYGLIDPPLPWGLNEF